MFKKFGMAILAMCFLVPAQVQAADEQSGVYIAPKFVLNVQHAKGEISYMGETLGSDSKTGARAGGALAIGYDFAPRFDMPIRAELEYGAYGNLSKTNNLYSVETSSSGAAADLKATVGIQTLLANIYWDIANISGFTPYVGGGIGMAFVKTEAEISLQASYAGLPVYSDSVSRSNTKTVFAGQVGLGCSYAFNDHISADLGYRFLLMGDGDVSESGATLTSKNNYAHQFMLGLRVTF